jgi:hypothetical protein
MRKLFKRRPSAGTIIGLLALVLALGGGAYAATKKKIEYKGLSKDARLKVLPFSKTNANTGTTPCDPTSASTFVDCTSVAVDGSTGFPRKYYIAFDGTFDAAGAPPARGDCRLEADNSVISGTTIRVETGNHAANHGDSYGINIITSPLGGKRTLSVACNETAGDLRVHQFQLSAFQVR